MPLRGGGGTRIKILEAFSYRRPVVTTAIGIEGIDAHHEQHALIADEPAAFAAACARLMHDAALAEQLASRAHTLFFDAYSLDALYARVRAW